jgi:predicted protein tyrosine phosphatase
MQSAHFTIGHSDEILPGIFLGGIFATTPDALRRHNIRAVLNVAGPHSTSVGKYPLVDHLIIEINDVPDAANDMTKKVFPKAFQFLDKYAHPKSPHKTPLLVHCQAGVSRSTTVLTGWLMKSFGLSMDKALTLIRERRPVVNPNYGFIRILREYEHFIKRWQSSRPNNNRRPETAAEYASRPINASQQHFQSQASFLTPASNLRSDELHSKQSTMFSPLQAQQSTIDSFVGAPISSQFIDDPLPNQWNNELKGIWDRNKYK